MSLLSAEWLVAQLEKPVFHELARHLQTRRLIAGDSLSLDQDKSFYCVVEGTVQVFARADHSGECQQSLPDEDDTNGYQLINEVGSGGTLSSLFTILSLFTEDVPMSWQDEDPTNDAPAYQFTTPPSQYRTGRADSDVSHLDLSYKSPGRTTRSSTSSTTSTVRSPASMDSPARSPPVVLEATSPRQRQAHLQSQVHQGIISRATVDSTLAVIPAEAFRRLIKKFPKASSHIVQGKEDVFVSDLISPFTYKVILARFSRVTFNAAHKYLGLTTEVLRTEKAINDIACHPLPATFYESGGLEHLRQRFDGAPSSVSVSSSDYFSLGQGSSFNTTSPLQIPTELQSTTPADKLQRSPTSNRGQPTNAKFPRDMVQAGDLFVSRGNSTDIFRTHNRSFTFSKVPQPSLNEKEEARKRSSGCWTLDDFDLREEVMSCIAKSIGLLQPALSGSDSAEASPAPTSNNSRRSSTATFSSPFTSLSLLDIRDDMSTMTGSSSVASGNYMSGLNNEVEILFYPAGTLLAKAGEINSGTMPDIYGRITP